MLVSVIRSIPPQAVQFVKAHEGCVLHVYADTVGVLTCGYGHTSPGLQLGAAITQDQADTYLAQDLSTAASRLEAQIGEDIVSALTDNQYAALLSFVFNLGTGPKRGDGKEWTIWKLLRAKQFISAADELTRFDKAGGRVLEGLVRRRGDEKVLYMTGAPQSVESAPPSSTTRTIDTPPTLAYVNPLTRSKSFVGSCVAACATVGSAVAPKIKDAADGASDAIAPYVGKSEVLGAVSSHLALVAAAAALAVPALLWLKNREARAS